MGREVKLGEKGEGKAGGKGRETGDRQRNIEIGNQ